MTVAFLVVALIADVALSIIVYILFKEVETLREHEQDIYLELVDLESRNRDSYIIQNTLKDNDDTCHKLYVKMENEVDDLEKRLTASHKYFEIKYSGILGNINNLWTHMDATEKVVLSLSEKTSNTSNTNASEHKIKEPHYRYRHHYYTYNSKPVRPIPDIPDCKEEVNENDANADSKEEQNTAKEDNAEVSKDNDFDIGQNTENDASNNENSDKHSDRVNRVKDVIKNIHTSPTFYSKEEIEKHINKLNSAVDSSDSDQFVTELKTIMTAFANNDKFYEAHNDDRDATIALKTAINSVYGLTSALKGKIAADELAPKSEENDTVTIEQINGDDIPTFNDPSSIQK